MSLHIWRKIYWVMNWDYPEIFDDKQRHLKYVCNEQIKKSSLKLRPAKERKLISKVKIIKKKKRNVKK